MLNLWVGETFHQLILLASSTSIYSMLALLKDHKRTRKLCCTSYFCQKKFKKNAQQYFTPKIDPSFCQVTKLISWWKWWTAYKSGIHCSHRLHWNMQCWFLKKLTKKPGKIFLPLTLMRKKYESQKGYNNLCINLNLYQNINTL